MSLITRLIRPEIRSQTSYYVADASNMVKLDAMENPYALPETLKIQLGAHLAQVALNRYPVPSYLDLKQTICRLFGVPAGYDVMLGNGSDELIAMLSVACAQTGACVMAPIPTFVMYAVSAQLAGLRFVGVPLTAELTLDMPAMLEAIATERPAILYLANPNNPTGSWFEHEQLIVLIEAMRDIGFVVLDEAYQPFAPGSMMAQLPQFAHLIVMRTMSKLGLAGLRLGYMSAAAELLAEIEKVRPPYNINVLSAAAAEFLLPHSALFDQQAATICAQRSWLSTALQELKAVKVFPSQANFVLIKVPNAEQIFKKLLEHKILVKNVGKMHPLLTDCLRVTVGTPEENRLFLETFVSLLSEPLS